MNPQPYVPAGADEIDMVIDRGAFLSGRYLDVFDDIVATKQACGDAHLKVILETGELATYDNIRRASWLAMLAGADRALQQLQLAAAIEDFHRRDRRFGRVRPAPTEPPPPRRKAV